MREHPKQPSKMERADRVSLAVLGHRIEVWSDARTGTGTLRDRIEKLEQALVAQIDTLHPVEPGTIDPEKLLLEEELDLLSHFRGSEDEFRELCEEKENFYVEVRAATILQMQGNGGTLPEA